MNNGQGWSQEVGAARAIVDWIKSELAGDPAVPTTTLLERATNHERCRELGIALYEGQRTAFFDMVRALRPSPRPSKALRPGQVSEHYVAVVMASFASGVHRPVPLLVSHLRYSGSRDYVVLRAETGEAVVDLLAEQLRRQGGAASRMLFSRRDAKRWGLVAASGALLPSIHALAGAHGATAALLPPGAASRRRAMAEADAALLAGAELKSLEELDDRLARASAVARSKNERGALLRPPAREPRGARPGGSHYSAESPW